MRLFNLPDEVVGGLSQSKLPPIVMRIAEAPPTNSASWKQQLSPDDARLSAWQYRRLSATGQ